MKEEWTLIEDNGIKTRRKHWEKDLAMSQLKNV